MTYKSINLPSNLSDEAYEFIKRFIDNLENTNTLSQLDEISLYLLADCYDQYLRASKITKEKGLIFVSDRNNESIAASVKIAKDCLTQCHSIMKELGGTIRSRSVIKQIVQEVEDSPLEQFLKGDK